MKSKMGVTLIKISSIYMVIGLIAGLIMGMSGNHSLVTVHSHLSLVGWATMAIIGLIYVVRPQCADNKLSVWHFWLHNIGLPVMIISLTLQYGYGNAEAEKFAGIGSIIIFVALLLFTINIYKNIGNS